MGGPLSDIRVLDLSRLVAGNQLTMLLADFGATVLKVERPTTGDPLRSWLTSGLDLDWKVYARNKRSIEIDLGEPPGRDKLLGLADSADVLVESFRPGTLERFGLGPDVLWSRNERLVVARVSGWGQTGSWASKPAFGTLVEALSGFAEANGFPDREPVLPPGALADMIAGTYGAFGVMLALRHAESTGRGQIVDVSLFESLFAILGPTAAMFAMCGERLTRLGNRSQTTAPRNLYRTRDGKWLALSASMQTMAERLFRAIGRPELVQDERFYDNDSRVRNVDALDEIISEYFAANTAHEVLERMEDARVTVGPVAEVSDLLDSDFFVSRGVVINVPDEQGAMVPMHNAVPRLSVTPGAVHAVGPRLGEHGDEPWPSVARA
jgi:crotonobetainyl-CoA:carnitine CoA-transferase CaiB-like acyl-CoA transferase